MKYLKIITEECHKRSPVEKRWFSRFSSHGIPCYVEWIGSILSRHAIDAIAVGHRKTSGEGQVCIKKREYCGIFIN